MGGGGGVGGGGNYGGYVKHKRNDSMCDPSDSRGDEKMQFLF